MLDFDILLQAIARQTVPCVGDLMLDKFVDGEVSRISPEAPAPVIPGPAQRDQCGRRRQCHPQRRCARCPRPIRRADGRRRPGRTLTEVLAAEPRTRRI